MTAIRASSHAARSADFDFLIGSWRVRHRKLRRRLSGDSRWYEFGGSMHARSILSELGNFDENILEDPQEPYQACTVRIFDPETSQWSIHWIDGRARVPDSPVVGDFKKGVGIFAGEDVLDGRPIRVRFIWSGMSERRARWEQAFSGDDGRSWERNWVMDLERS